MQQLFVDYLLHAKDSEGSGAITMCEAMFSDPQRAQVVSKRTCKLYKNNEKRDGGMEQGHLVTPFA